MADATCEPPPLLLNDLVTRGHEFSFDQVMRLARVVLGPGRVPGLPEASWQERLRIRPDLSLAFPAADVAHIELSDHGHDEVELRVITTFLGLYGSSSPLPNHYTEDLLDEAAAESSVSRDFLDIIHQRLYELYCECWSKYRLFIRVAEEKNPRDRERLFCLIGLGQKEFRDSLLDAWSLLRYAGLFNQSPRSAEGLQTLLRDALGIRRLTVDQCILRQAPIPPDQRTFLGASRMNLGQETILGSEMADRMGKFRIEVGPLAKDDFNLLLPGTPRHEKLARLVRLYLTDPFDFDVRITVSAGQIGPLSLDAPHRPGLGLNTWCFSGDTLDELSVTFGVVEVAEPAAQASSSAEPDLPADFLDMIAESQHSHSLIDYYQEELARLRDLARSFVQSYPELASMMGGPQADPEVERLLEGVAYLNAHLQLKLKDDFPELIHDVINAIHPNSLHPIPATTIIAFSPKPNCFKPQIIPGGIEIRSVEVDGTACRFSTRYPVEVHPLSLTGASLVHPPGKPLAITLKMNLLGIDLCEWEIKSLRLFLSGKAPHASNLYLVLMRYLKRIVITPFEDGETMILDASHLAAVGFEKDEALFPSHAGIPYHQVLHEFFVQPDKFRFVDVFGWEQWTERGRGSNFEIKFELNTFPFELDPVGTEDFTLFATPAVNVFAHRAEPITITDGTIGYRVIPEERKTTYAEVYSIEKVYGFLDGASVKAEILPGPFIPENGKAPVYSVSHNTSKDERDMDTCISINISDKAVAARTMLEVHLLCTNGDMPQKLKIGDICKGSDSSPECATFRNCKAVTRSRYAPVGNNVLWRLYALSKVNISHMNCLKVKSILKLLALPFKNDHVMAHHLEKYIDGITGVKISPAEEVAFGSLRKVWEIGITLKEDGYDSPGEAFVFSKLLAHLMESLAGKARMRATCLYKDGKVSYQWSITPNRDGK